jgi:uncharacterized membrane protein
MTLFETLKLIHVLAAMMWVGGGILQTIYAVRARRADDAHRLGFARDMVFLGSRVFGTASGVALIFGVWMVFERPGFTFGDTWIIIGLAGFALSSAIGVAFFTPKGKALLARLEAGEQAESLLATVTRVAFVDQFILLVVVWAMVVKPGA